MKCKKYPHKIDTGNFILLYLIIICSISYINNYKFKNLIMNINSKSNIDSREKENKILEDLKEKISKK
jgi:hypothetical protein